MQAEEQQAALEAYRQIASDYEGDVRDMDTSLAQLVRKCSQSSITGTPL